MARTTVLVVDDLRIFPPLEQIADVTYARTAGDGLEMLQRQRWDEVWLDYDLGTATGKKEEVTPVVDRLDEMAYFKDPLSPEVVVVHTSNLSGRDKIVSALQRRYRLRVIDAAEAGGRRDPHIPETDSEE